MNTRPGMKQGIRASCAAALRALVSGRVLLPKFSVLNTVNGPDGHVVSSGENRVRFITSPDGSSFGFREFYYAGVPTLFRLGSPAAIFRGVITVIVDAVQRFSLRTLPHVRQEGIEVSPLVADFDASPSVVMVVSIFRVITTTKHGAPRVVFPSAIFAMTHPNQATTTFGIARTKVVASDYGSFSASAATKPHCSTLLIAGLTA